MKKIFCLILVLTLSISNFTMAFAEEHSKPLTEQQKYELALSNVDIMYSNESSEFREYLKDFITENYERRVLKVRPQILNSLPSGYFSKYTYTENVKEREKTTTRLTLVSGAITFGGKFAFPLSVLGGVTTVNLGMYSWELAQFEDDSVIEGDVRSYWTDEANYEYIVRWEERYILPNGVEHSVKTGSHTGDFNE